MAVKPPATDPFALTGPKQIDAIVKRFVGMQGTPQTDAQIQASARAQVDPLVAALTKNVNDRAAASTQAIKGLTDSYAGELGRIDFGAPYDQAKLEQAAVSDSLRGALAGAGSDLASQLRARMAPIGGDPAVAEAVSSLASRGADLGTTELARGSSALSSLIASGAAAESYGQKLPAIARLSGLQGVNDVNSRAVNDIASGSQDILGQVPSIVQALRNSRDNLRGNRASMGADLYTTLTGQNVTKATAKAGLSNQNFDNRLNFAGTFGYDPKTKKPVPGFHKDKGGNVTKDAAPTKPKVNTKLSADLGYLVDDSGDPILKNGKKQMLPKPKTKPNAPLGLSAKDYQAYNSQALGAARNYHSAWVDDEGNENDPLTWQQYLTHGMAAGIPIAILIAQGKKVYSARERKLGLIPSQGK